eukprot:TRINITY_DN4664_c0_g1_i1.p1 TRINITY_DN4664_c0_g1~~TRINITY_DN4664_c0_g1_i1.p1  ORF type:complete len:129 (+),score=32.06 TRINITY_DN4664_c0_g1_i1:28-414(+)
MAEVDASTAATHDAPPQEPQGAIEDIVTSIVTPGYVGGTVWKMLTGAIALFCLITIVVAYNDPSSFNLYSLLILIPAVGLLFAFRWFMAELEIAKAAEASKKNDSGNEKSQADTKAASPSKAKKRRVD